MTRKHRDYVCHNGIVNCVNHRPADDPEEEARQKQYRQLEARAKFENIDLKVMDQKFQDFKFNPKMRPCGGDGPCKCFMSQDYEWSDSDECSVMTHIEANGVKKQREIGA